MRQHGVGAIRSRRDLSVDAAQDQRFLLAVAIAVAFPASRRLSCSEDALCDVTRCRLDRVPLHLGESWRTPAAVQRDLSEWPAAIVHDGAQQAVCAKRSQHFVVVRRVLKGRVDYLFRDELTRLGALQQALSKSMVRAVV